MSRDPNTSLRQDLEACDPAALAAPLTASERDHMRTRLLAAATDAREAVAAPGGLRPAWALGALVVVALAAGLWLGRPAAPPSTAALDSVDFLVAPRHAGALTAPHPLQPRVSLGSRAQTDLPAGRTIHFTAPRGTRLVWVVPGRTRDAG